MKVFFASDHAGFDLKHTLIEFVKNIGHETEDCGPFSFDPHDDYPDFIGIAAKRVCENPEIVRAIIIGGSGEGEAIVANRYRGVRAAVFYGGARSIGSVDISGGQSADSYEIVRLMREHNDANILSLGARFVSKDEACEAVRVFLATPFSHEERHIRRIKKMDI